MKKNYFSKTPILDQTLKKSNKKNVFLFFFILVLGLAHTYAQNVNIPDDVFKAIMVNNVDANSDGEISVEEALAFTGKIDLHQKAGLTELTGIEAFENVTEIQIGNNSDLGNDEVEKVTGGDFPDLWGFYLNNTGITEIDLTNLTSLTHLEANNNNLTSIDVSALPDLTSLNLANQFPEESGVDEDGLTLREHADNLLRAGLTEIIGLENLVDLDYLHVGQNALTSLDVSNNTKLTTVEAGNNKLTSFDASTLNKGIVDGVIVGIQKLDLKFNELITLNLANGLNAVDDNSGDLNPNFLGTSFYLQGSNFRTTPDPHNNELNCILFDEDLDLNDLPTTGIVFTTDNNGVGLFGSYTYLTYKGTTIFSNDPCEFDIPDETFKRMLTTRTTDTVDDVEDYVGNAVFGQGVDIDGNGEISYEEAASFTGTLELGNLRPRIESLVGIEAFTNLTGLRVFGNALTAIDMSKNVNLIHFNAAGQSDEDGPTLIAVNLANGNNVNMENGDGNSGYWNTGNPNLSCMFVDADFYDANNGSDGGIDLVWPRGAAEGGTTYCKNYVMINNDRTAVYDDDIEALLKPIDANFHRRLLNHQIDGNLLSSGYVEGGNGGGGAGIAEEINIHFVDRVVAENFYSDAATVDGNNVLDPAGVISYYEATAFTGKLWLDGEIIENTTSSYRTILDFNGDDDDTGLETFVNITELDMHNNFQIEEESLNLETLTKLTDLDISSCNFGRIEIDGTQHPTITTLDLSLHTALEKLYLSVNDLTELDLSNNPNLIELDVSDNRLRELDVSDNTLLTNLDLSINDIEVLDLTNNRVLTDLDFSRNYMASIDLSNQSELEVLRSEFNFLTSLDVSNNTKLTELSLYRNELELLNIANGANEELTSLYFSQTDDADYSYMCCYGNYENDGTRPHGDPNYGDDERVNADNSSLIINEDNEASCILVDDAAYSDTNWSPLLDKSYRFVDLKDFTTNYTAVLVNGQYTLTPDDVYIDDCLNVGLSFSSDSQTEFTCADAGTVVEVGLIATYGDISVEETVFVGVTAGTQVTAVTQDITVTLDANGRGTITPDDIDDGSGVVCDTGNVTLSLDRTNFSVDDIGTPVTVTLTVTDQSTNTSVTATAQVTVVAFDPDNPDPDPDPDPDEDNSIAAKGFSPNGDGVGDTWVIEGIQDYPGNTVQIFSQWGEAVFQASGYQNDFEGISNKTGGSRKRLPAGPYLYIINFNDAAMAPERGWVYINY